MIATFWNPSMVADSKSFSPSSAKAAALAADFSTMEGVELRKSRAATVGELKLAHDPDYVDGVMACELPNGFRNFDRAVAASLPFQTGSLMDAALHALNGGDVACSLSAGFHHTGYASGGGFCTFNGLMVTAIDLMKTHGVQKVGILDLDYHWGDGTADIITRKRLTRRVKHVTWRDLWSERLQDLDLGDAGLFKLFKGVDIMLYQAGADMHVDDPLGGVLNDQQLSSRDAMVFAMTKRHDIPVAWNLAGGYQRDSAGTIEPVLRIHRETMRRCVEAYASQSGRDGSYLK